MMPSQKCGTESPESATRLAATSIAVPRRAAEMTPAGMPITQRDEHRADGQLDRHRQLGGEQLGHRDPVAQRLAEIAAQHLAHPDAVLHRHRPVEVVLARGSPPPPTGSCSSPASARAASPGRSCCSEKISTETKNSVGTSTASRRAM